ncbi:MAG: MMPL family transporter [Eubacterium sp.]|nr:MMPL family transporter [Eubacterium sp.]
MKLGKKIVALRVPILILALVLLIPAAIGYLNTRTNYDILTYLPKDIETMKGQDILAEDFGTGAFSMVVIEGMEDKDIVKMADDIEGVDHVVRVVSYASATKGLVPIDILPDEIRDAVKSGDSQLMAIFYDTTISADETLKAVEDVRKVAGDNVYVGGMSALVIDTKNLSDIEVPIYVAIAVALCLLVLMVSMDSFLIPILFLLSIGFAIVYNMGSNVFMGQISYVTKALAAVLQLAVTMDYSIFLWHSYCEEKALPGMDKHEAMAIAIEKTFSSVVGSSITTVAGFVALCFMSFTLGLDMGIVMAKGVVIGVICCVTVLPSMIMVLDKAIEKTSHRPIVPDFSRISKWVVKHFYIGLILFAILIIPAYYGQSHNDVYYNLDSSLPKDLKSIQANEKLEQEFNMNSTHMLLLDSNLKDKDVRSLIKEINDVKGVKATLGLQSLVGAGMPNEMIPEKIRDIVDDGEYQLMFIMSEYKIATDEVNEQCDKINEIIDKYDEKGMLIGEAPCTLDLIKTTDRDFAIVNIVSIVLVGLIIIFVFRSLSLPVLLVSVIEFAIFINMAIPHYTGVVLPFIASIVIGTIQLGSTVDYAILMTNKYMVARSSGMDKNEAVTTALSGSINSIFVSALSFFAATIGVAIYSKIDMISALCMLMSRGAIVSMFVVILLLPAVLKVFDGLIIHTTVGFKEVKKEKKEETMVNHINRMTT